MQNLKTYLEKMSKGAQPNVPSIVPHPIAPMQAPPKLPISGTMPVPQQMSPQEKFLRLQDYLKTHGG